MLICIALAGGYFVLQKINYRDGVADFRVYYDAALHWVSGESPYGQAFGVSSGYYKYSPLALVPFSAFVWMPYPIACAVYYFLVLAAFVYFSLVLTRFFETHFNFPSHRRGFALAATTIFLADHFERELHLGNVNVFLLIASFGLYRLMCANRHLAAGFLFAAILLVKPHFAILIPFFVLTGHWRLLLFSVVGLTAGFLLPAVVSGWQGNLTLHSEWISTMQAHNVRLSESPNTIYGIINDWVLGWIGLKGGSGLVLGVLLAVAGIFLLVNRKNVQLRGADQSGFIGYFTLVALIPNLAHTDTEHFMWTWPLIAFILMNLIYRQLPYRSVLIALTILAFIPYCVNSPDLVGRKVMLLFDEGGLLGLSNLLLIALAAWIFRHSSMTQTDMLYAVSKSS